MIEPDTMDRSEEYLKAFIGQGASALPTPSLILHHQILKRNTSRLLEDVEAAKIGFRAHVKTLKVRPNVSKWNRMLL